MAAQAIVVLGACSGEIADPNGERIVCEEPGYVPLRRLTRADYRRSVRDLLGPEIDPDGSLTEAFPPDDVAFGFDNMGIAQRITSAHFERYFTAARTVADRALRPPAEPLDVVVEAEEAGAFSAFGGIVDRDAGDLPGTVYFIDDGTVSSEPLAFVDGTYEISVRAFARMENVEEGADLVILEGDLPVDRFFVDATAPETHVRTVRLVQAFESIRIRLVNHAYSPTSLPLIAGDCMECTGTDRICLDERCRALEPCVTDAECATGLCLDGLAGAPAGRYCASPRRFRTLYLDRFTVRGPLDGPRASPIRDRLLVCDPDVLGREPCARRILAIVAPRVWRRPLEGDELDRLVALAMHEEAPDFDTGLRVALHAMFLSPSFLFRVEPGVHDGVRPLTEHEVATRLSYMLWGSTPDQELLDLADRGQLVASLPEQVDRMLADPRAAGLTDGFFGQWLSTRTLRAAPLDRDPALYPDFDFDVQTAMAEEIENMVAAHLGPDRPVTGLLTTDEMFGPEPLRAFYGPEARPAGLLTAGGLLALNAMRSRTSIVARGNWVLGNLLCAPTPDPPPDVAASIPDELGTGATLREQMAAHRADPACAGCHQAMDNIGFGLEAYDAVGRFRRTDEAGNALDTSGRLPGGQTFAGAEELGEVLAGDPRFARCIAQKLATYGIGRAHVTEQDACRIGVLVERAGGDEATLRSLIHAVVQSPLFLTRRNE